MKSIRSLIADDGDGGGDDDDDDEEDSTGGGDHGGGALLWHGSIEVAVLRLLLMLMLMLHRTEHRYRRHQVQSSVGIFDEMFALLRNVALALAAVDWRRISGGMMSLAGHYPQVIGLPLRDYRLARAFDA